MRTLYDIEDRITHLGIPKMVKADAIAVYHIIAQVESEARGVPVEGLDFDELSNIPAESDIVGACLRMYERGPGSVEDIVRAALENNLSLCEALKAIEIDR